MKHGSIETLTNYYTPLEDKHKKINASCNMLENKNLFCMYLSNILKLWKESKFRMTISKRLDKFHEDSKLFQSIQVNIVI
jgi:hypothetical protein